jgi:hypothetical protein
MEPKEEITYFPNYRVVCSTHCEDITQQNVDDLINACKKNNIEIYYGTLEKMIDHKYPYYVWEGDQITQSGSARGDIQVPFEMFLAYAEGRVDEDGNLKTSKPFIGKSTAKSKPKFLY